MKTLGRPRPSPTCARRRLVWLPWMLACACGSNGSGRGGSPEPISAYPAPHPALPQVLSDRGPVLTAPQVVPIVFQGDPLASGIQTFLSQVVAAPYWQKATAEYGVGLLSALPTVTITEAPPATLADTDVQAWLASQIGSPNFPQPTANTIYAIFYPDSTTVTLASGTGCQDVGGYHSDFALPGGMQVTYAVVLRCPPPVPSVGPLDNLTATTSHELIEAATDPLPFDAPAFLRVDSDHGSWELAGGGEVGDVCAGLPHVWIRPPGIDNLVQRVWSNRAAAASHDPCQPQGATPYFNSAPVLPDAIMVSDSSGTEFKTAGVRVAVGQEKSIELDLFSDAPTPGPWKVSVFDVISAFSGAAPVLSLSLSASEGKNGDVLHLTIHALRAAPNGTAPFWIVNDLGSTSTVWMAAVAN